jgi:peptidoglycan hydrolase-like amidase
MAESGKDWQEVLDYYYPGASLRKCGAGESVSGNGSPKRSLAAVM